MFKIELFFDESLGEAELKKLGAKIDKIFAEDNIKKADKTLTSRTYYDNGKDEDFGRIAAALCEIKNTMNHSAFIRESYFYDDDEKEDLIVEFFGR